MKPGIVFDLDGTLIDSLPDLTAAANLMLADAGQEPLLPQEVRGFIGNGVPKLVERVAAARGIADADRLPSLLAGFKRHYDAAPAALTTLYPGVFQALGELQADGYPMAVCTNKPEAPARVILTALTLDGFFPAVIGGDTLGVHKPDPAPLTATISALGVTTAVFVGDSEVDCETAARAGLPFLLYRHGYRKTPVEELRHHAVFDDFADLPALIRTL